VSPPTKESLALAHIFNVAFDAPEVDNAGMKWLSSEREHDQRTDREELFAAFARVMQRCGDKAGSSPSDIARTIIARDILIRPGFDGGSLGLVSHAALG
jgi:hypothetical protein